MQTIYKTTRAARSILDTADDLRAALGEPDLFAVFDDGWSADVSAIYFEDDGDHLICTVADTAGGMVWKDGCTMASYGFPYGGGFGDLDVMLREAIFPYDDEPDYSDVISSIVFVSPGRLADLISFPVAT